MQISMTCGDFVKTRTAHAGYILISCILLMLGCALPHDIALKVIVPLAAVCATCFGIYIVYNFSHLVSSLLHSFVYCGIIACECGAQIKADCKVICEA